MLIRAFVWAGHKWVPNLVLDIPVMPVCALLLCKLLVCRQARKESPCSPSVHGKHSASQQALEPSSGMSAQVQVGPKRHKVDVFMTTDADFNDSVRCYMFLLQSDIFRDRTRGSIYQHVR